jgi:hypothetical protein
MESETFVRQEEILDNQNLEPHTEVLQCCTFLLYYMCMLDSDYDYTPARRNISSYNLSSFLHESQLPTPQYLINASLSPPPPLHNPTLSIPCLISSRIVSSFPLLYPPTARLRGPQRKNVSIQS